ncbi:SprT family protein [Gracilibacillus dipsosauri]|uniref:Protein SprT-like n=1 Tax=Gracilibacillus dipsosauri TaxID=178340 RepID=A0A317KX49_9BACI|nr:SprT family protein [Gracilibacillus dipsosauri]PWU68077.1 SprT family protein [Gracilibacillus dipsosauri]
MDLLNEQELVTMVEQLSKKYFNKPFVDTVTYNPRLRTTGGRYIPSKRRIELNPKYALEFEKEELIGIIKHELCHYHLHIEGKGYKHRDKDFRELLKKTGSPRHCRPLPSLESTYRYHYECKDCQQSFPRKRKINLSRYRCGKCHGKLQLIE